MCTILLEIGALPNQSVATRRHSVRPQIRSPQHYRRHLLRVAQGTRPRIRCLPPHLVYLGLYRPLHRESFLVGKRLWIPVVRRITTVARAGNENELQVWIPHPERPYCQSDISEKDISIRTVGRKRYGGRRPRPRSPHRVAPRVAPIERRHPRNR